jgi:hypothetical protein
VPDFEVPSGENDMKKRRLPEKAAFVIGFHKFSEDSSLFDFPSIGFASRGFELCVAIGFVPVTL